MPDKTKMKKPRILTNELKLLKHHIRLGSTKKDFARDYKRTFGRYRTPGAVQDMWFHRTKLIQRLLPGTSSLKPPIPKPKAPKVKKVGAPPAKAKPAKALKQVGSKDLAQVLHRFTNALDRNTEMQGDLYKAHRETQRLLNRVLGVTKDGRGGT